jgi:GT2 family glycosyltransferase
MAGIEAQGVPGIEVIAINDGSTDGSAEWLLARRATAPWLSVLETNGIGPNAARNQGIAVARAPFVAFLDTEDAWLPGKLAAQLAFHIANSKVAFTFTDCVRIDVRGAAHGTWFGCWPAFRRLSARASAQGFRLLDRAPARLLAEGVVVTSTVMIRRNLVLQLSGFDETLPLAVDRDLWLRLARTGPVGFTATCGACHSIARTAGPMSGGLRVWIACMRRILASHAPAVVLGPGGAAAVRRARAHILAAEADLAHSESRHRSAAVIRLKALWRSPSVCLALAFLHDLVSACAHKLMGTPESAGRYSAGKWG